MVAVLADPILYQFTGGEPPERDALRRRYRRQVAGSPRPGELWWNWVIRLPSEGCLVGFTQATVSPPSSHRRVEVAWVLGTPWQGHGYAREAAGALTTWLVAHHALGEVVAHIHPDNHASAAVATSIGMAVTDLWRDGERRWRLVT
ncbi:GNAT family N-acetyltransferase [Spiractinospora alimapuensis]|nr:GNAT family N-acetyltransferase [Spiractinospora alimapuensis]